MDINFSKRGTGACPLCRNFKGCRILGRMKDVLSKEVEAKYDNELEAVIYRCPEFEEQ